MKTSVVLSSYNGAEYIREQLDSLKNQTCDVDEVLILDDCSTDNTVEVVTRYIENNDLIRWRVEVNKKNIGWRKNFISGIKKCTGDVIFTCDQDDIWLPAKIEKMTAIMKNGGEIGMLASSYVPFSIDKPYDLQEFGTKTLKRVSLPDNLLDVPYPGCTYCIRRTFFEECYPYWIETCPHDALLWRSAAIRGCLYLWDEPLILWRKHSDSAFQSEISRVTRQSELDWRSKEEAELQKLQIFADDYNCSIETKNMIVRNLRWCQLRSSFVAKKNVVGGLRLLAFRKQYHSVKRYVKDWFIAFGG